MAGWLMNHMKRFLIIGGRDKYGYMEDFAVLFYKPTCWNTMYKI